MNAISRSIPFCLSPVIIVAAIFIATACASAEPVIPKDMIPADIDSKVELKILNLYSDDRVARGRAAYDLGEMGSKARPAIPFLMAVMHDQLSMYWNYTHSNSYTGRQTTGTVATSTSEEALKALDKIDRDWRNSSQRPFIAKQYILRLKETKWPYTENVVKALGILGDNIALEPLIDALDDSQPEVRKQAAIALGRIKDHRATDALVLILRSRDCNGYYSCSTVAEAIGEIRSPFAAELLIPLLRVDRNRHWIIEALGNTRDARGVDPLIELLSDSNQYIRNEATRALGKINDRRATVPLIALLKDSYVQQAAVRALAGLKDTRAIRPLIELLKDKNTVSMAQDALSYMREIIPMEILVESSNDSNESVRNWATRTIWQLKNKK